MDATFLPGSNPVLTRELRVLLRNARTFALLAIYVAILGAADMAQFPAGQELNFDNGRADLGRPLFTTFFAAQVVMILVMVPGLATGALAQERERRTLEPLLLTPMTPLGIIWGKAAGVLALAGLLLLATLPITSLCFLLGGVSPGELITAYAFLLGMALFTTALGLFCAAKYPSTTQATLLCYAQLPILLAIISIFLLPGMLISGILILVWAFYRMAMQWKELADTRLPKRIGQRVWSLLLIVVQVLLAVGLMAIMLANYEIGIAIVGVLFVASYLVFVAYYIFREAAREIAQKPTSSGPMRERVQDFKEEWQRAVSTPADSYVPAPTGPYSYSPIAPKESDPFAALAYDQMPDAPLPGMPRPTPRAEVPIPTAVSRTKATATYGIEPFLSDTLNPIYAKDMRTGLLGKAQYFVRFAYAAMIISELMVLFMVWQGTSSRDIWEFANTWANLHLLLLMTTGAWFGARALAPEREQQTLPQLLTVPLPASAIIGGKMMAAMTYTLYVYLMALPLMLLLPAIGEIPWGAAFVFLQIELVFGAVAAAWGLYCSIQAITVRRALSLALSGVLALIVGGPVITNLVITGLGTGLKPQDPILRISQISNDLLLPLSALGHSLLRFHPAPGRSSYLGFTPGTSPLLTLLTLVIYAFATGALLLATSHAFKRYAQNV